MHERVELPKVKPLVSSTAADRICRDALRSAPARHGSSQWIFRCEDAEVHHAASTRGGCVVHEILDGHRPAVWLSDRYSAPKSHAERQQTCPAHLARDVVYALDADDATHLSRHVALLNGSERH